MQRIFNFAQTQNFRELGGYPTSDGNYLRWHKILRAGYLSALTPEELNYLKNYGLRYSFDLRSPYERQNWPDPQVDFLTLYQQQLYDVDSQPIGEKLYQTLPAKQQFDGLAGIYQKVVLDHHSQQIFHNFFQLLLANQQPNESVVFHCSAGKDRTGILAILLLLVLHVPVDYITQDYLLTNLMYTHAVDLSYLNNPNDRTIQAMNFTPADKSCVTAIQIALTTVYGSLDNFEQTILGFSPTKKQLFLQLYTTSTEEHNLDD
ncbi:tyrosine-protein phosphatase [Bombilactobacillus folatiphilus]|uniref:Tyrosine-protein phosphatase n=1 Tax=Bombilactobacillus folatiphilus TaxID=2923362 RepID=A0ABY4P8T5_9LACO|nr:tyrosine-protein phosphatase [Bombilactobacillus folatiphilus]UQS82027.1 tyrosine-protein phosphatase [Bombilactobacillus folatiphilus]